MAIRRLREKLEDEPHRPQLIKTVRGMGYRLESE
jgi:DNA-binding response OmpR family regulator